MNGGIFVSNEKVIPQDKRFVTIKQYCKISGLSYATVKHLMVSGQLNYITTERGLQRIDTREVGNEIAVLEKLDKTEKMLAALCKQFNTVV